MSDISTKFSVGDTIYFLWGHQIHYGPVKSIQVRVGGGNISIRYEVGLLYGYIYEDSAYASQQELISHLEKTASKTIDRFTIDDLIAERNKNAQS